MAGNTVKEMITNFGKLDKFEWHDFRRWQKKMRFLLTTLKVVYVLTTLLSDLMDDDTVEAIRRRAKWENDDCICKRHILFGMSDSLFDIYHNVESAKELWDSLESKYMAVDASSKKFRMSNFNNYKMVDSRPVMEQFNELFRILGQYTQYGLKMDESISISSVIDKLPPSWMDFKHTLKHGKEVVGPSMNIKEEGGKNINNKQNRGKKLGFNENNGGSGSNKKPKLESFYVQIDAIAWWIDSGATTYVYKDRCWFKTYESVEDGFVLYMGDDHLASVYEKGSVVLKFILGKSITLFNVLFVLKFCKNLISGPVLNKCGYRQVAVVRLSDPKRKTSGEKDINYIFVGYAEHSKAYRPKDIIPNSDESQTDDHSNDVLSETPELRRAMLSRDAAFWKEAINNEIGPIILNNTWVLSDLSLGFRQKEGIDYFDTYALVARSTIIRLLLALAPIHNLVIHQMDVKTTILNGDLEEEMYIKQPKGFVMLGNEHKVCKMVKSLYELKQAPKQWHQKSDEVVLSSGFLLNQYDKCVYSKFDESEAYSNASWINHVEDSSSTSRWVFLLGGGFISWASKNQTFITGSTMESEFVALAAAGKEVEWLKNLIYKIPIWPKPIALISIHFDSVSILAKAYSQIYNDKSRHLGVRHNMIRELIMNGVISIEFVRS
uniref:Zinc finger, CCHC-type n=1 Tax=Tanacetum cinerariifolium TaxID=118510 RepID=A0A6L2L2F4_TANCI|nr:zinc finger, CCHC-type [Tanacetum cinerariifolium]